MKLLSAYGRGYSSNLEPSVAILAQTMFFFEDDDDSCLAKSSSCAAVEVTLPCKSHSSTEEKTCATKFYESKEHWLQETPLLGCLEIAGDAETVAVELPASWLVWHDELPSQSFGLGCRVCAAAKVASPWGKLAITQDAKSSSSLHLGNLKKHANSLEHRKATIDYVRQHGIAVSSDGVADKCAPKEDLFLNVLQHVY